MAQLPEDVKKVIAQYATKYPIPVSNETASQDWTHKLAQQLKFSFPSAGWGHKSAGSGRPHSKDVVALSSPFVGWDVILGAGTSNPTLQLDGDSIDLSGQVFEQVDAQDFLGSAPPIPPEPPDDEIVDLLVAILAELKKQTALLVNMGTSMTGAVAEIKQSIEGGIKVKLG